jgi:hypothetical protein
LNNQVLSLSKKDVTRYDVPKAALTLLEGHGYYFKEYLTVDTEKMFGRLFKLIIHKNVLVKNKGFDAFNSFISNVSYVIMEGGNQEINLKTFKILIKKFQGLLESSNKDQLSMGISGIGYFAMAIKKFLNDDMKKILLSLFQLSEGLLSNDDETRKDSM